MKRVIIYFLLLILVLLASGCAQLHISDNNFRMTPDVIKLRPITPSPAVMVVGFRWNGENDAKYYATGFARAVSDSIYCAPKHLTQQFATKDIYNAIACTGAKYTDQVQDEAAIAVAEKIGAQFCVTGDFSLIGGRAKISIHIADVAGAKKSKTLDYACSINELPAMQSKAAPLILEKIGIKPDQAALSFLKTPLFSKSETIRLYGLSFFSEIDECKMLRWKAVDTDPVSLFPYIHLLEYYVNSEMYPAELKSDMRLSDTLKTVESKFADNSFATILRGMLLIKMNEFQQAFSLLKQLEADDYDMVKVHSILSSVARARQDDKTALAEAKLVVDAQPKNSEAYAQLAFAYSQVAADARRGRYFGNMSSEVRGVWKENTKLAYETARMAIELNPDNYNAWSTVMLCSREFGYKNELENAFKQLIRISPQSVNAYVDYAFSFSPQWGGTDAKQKEIFDLAKKAFPHNSYKPLVIKALALHCNYPENGRVNGKYADEMLKIANQINIISGGAEEEALNVACKAYIMNKQREKYYQTAEKAFKRYGGIGWQYKLGLGCGFMYEDKQDTKYLERARDIYADYIDEIPNNPYGHTQYGWCLSHLGDTQEAKAQFEKALKIDPGNEEALKRMQYVQ